MFKLSNSRSGIPLYNGNISQTSWNTLNIDSSTKTYSYSYDGLNRITQAIDNTGNYNLNAVSYDKNGNIVSLQRQGHTNSNATSFGIMDNLQYTYYTDSNQLKKVLDTGNKTHGFNDAYNAYTEYTYDDNGNMISDANKGITRINFNHLNLPIKVVFHNSDTKTISYRYTADGTKLRKVVNDNGIITRTDYAGSYIYENNQFQFFNHPEGYVKNDNGIFNYVYQYKDQVNNVRISYSDINNDGIIQPATEILHEQNYYPFGLLHKGYNNNIIGVVNNRKQYQGQEFTEDLGLNTHEWKYRVSDPAIGRFWQIDPLAEDYNYQSPYNFSENRVIDSYELEGLEKVSIHSRSFAPFKTFGGGFKGGGNRKFSTGNNVTARIGASVNVDLAQGSSSMSMDKPVGHPTSSDWFGRAKSSGVTDIEDNTSFTYSKSYETVMGGKQTRNGIDVDFGFAKNNKSFLWGTSPDIDVDLNFRIEGTGNANEFTVFGGVYGDNFPSNETFMTDASGQSIFLGVSGADGSPFYSLWSDGGETMSSFRFNLTFDNKGNFSGIKMGKKTYTIDEWNKQFTKLDPQDGTKSKMY